METMRQRPHGGQEDFGPCEMALNHTAETWTKLDGYAHIVSLLPLSFTPYFHLLCPQLLKFRETAPQKRIWCFVFWGECLFSYTSSVSTNLYIHYYHTTDKITKSERDCDSEVLWNRVWGDNWKQALSYGSKSGMATEQCVAVTEGAHRGGRWNKSGFKLK